MLAAATTHTTGVNWSQVIATGVTILTGLAILAGFVSNRIERYRRRNAESMAQTIHDVTDVLSARVEKVDRHLETQDKKADTLARRVWRIEQWFINRAKKN